MINCTYSKAWFSYPDVLQVFAVHRKQDTVRSHQFHSTLDVNVGHNTTLVVLQGNKFSTLSKSLDDRSNQQKLSSIVWTFVSLVCEFKDKRWILMKQESCQDKCCIYIQLELLHCINTKSLLLVLRKCQPALIFQSCLRQQMEQSGEQWGDWQREADKKSKQHLHLNCSVAQCLSWQ